MTLPGLVQANNLSDVENREKVWDNIGNGITYEISGVTTSGVVIKGKDILSLNGVRLTSTSDFERIKGLTATAQPRLNIAANNTASGVAKQLIAMPKNAPLTNGNYSFGGAAVLSGQTLFVNGASVSSISSSPFSGSTATTLISLSTFAPQVNWRITEPMSSGTLSSPEIAIPFETSDFVLFIKAGQS